MTTSSIIDVIADALMSPAFGMDQPIAANLATAIIQAAAARGHAGADYYLPSHNNQSRSERNAAIRAEFNGRNLKAICRKYAVSKATVYRACRRLE